jgi:hypothetical protein
MKPTHFPTVEQYSEQLRPFVDAGYEVKFENSFADRTSVLHGKHLKREFIFSVDVPEHCLTLPAMMLPWLDNLLEQVEADIKQNHPVYKI